MIALNIVDRGSDSATLESIIKSTPVEQLDSLLKACDIEVHNLLEEPDPEEYEPLEKSDIIDLVKATKLIVGKDSKGKTKVLKRIECYNSKTGTRYYQWRKVNADVAGDAELIRNPMRTFDEKVAKATSATAHLTEEAANITDMLSTPGGEAAFEAINAAIGTGSGVSRLTKGIKYTNIQYCKDPIAGVDENGEPVYHACLAKAKNPNTGKTQYFYSKQYRETAKAIRTERTMIMASPKGRAWIESTLDYGDLRTDEQKAQEKGLSRDEKAELAAKREDIRDCLKLMYSYGMKSGNELGDTANQLGEFVTAGATTLKAGNVNIVKKKLEDPETGKMENVDVVVLQFYQQGEKGDKAHQQAIEITDPVLTQRLIEKKNAAASDDDRIFSCTKDDTLAVTKALFGCNNEDLRAAFGIRQGRSARNAILGNNAKQAKLTRRKDPKTGKQKRITFKQAEMEIAKILMYEMGTTDKRSVEPFLNKKMIALFQEKSTGNVVQTAQITKMLKEMPALKVKETLLDQGYWLSPAQEHKINMGIQADKKAKENGELPLWKKNANKKDTKTQA